MTEIDSADFAHFLSQVDEAKAKAAALPEWQPPALPSLERAAKTRENNGRILITAFGQTHTICGWAKKTGLSFPTIFSRIYRHGWNIERALSTPARKKTGTFLT